MARWLELSVRSLERVPLVLGAGLGALREQDQTTRLMAAAIAREEAALTEDLRRAMRPADGTKEAVSKPSPSMQPSIEPSMESSMLPYAEPSIDSPQPVVLSSSSVAMADDALVETQGPIAEAPPLCSPGSPRPASSSSNGKRTRTPQCVDEAHFLQRRDALLVR